MTNFDQNWPKFGHIWLYRSSVSHNLSLNPFITFSETLELFRFKKAEKMFQALFDLSTELLETLGVASVRPFVRPYVRNAFSRKPLITFSETLQLVRACRRKKNVPSAFLIIFTVLAKNC